MFLVWTVLLVWLPMLLRLWRSGWSGGDSIFFHPSAVGLRMAWPGELSGLATLVNSIVGGHGGQAVCAASPRTWRTSGPQAEEGGTRQRRLAA